MRFVPFFLALLLLPQLAAAQAPHDTLEVDGLDGISIPSWGKAIIDSFDKPVHPVLGGVASGGGLGAGFGYDSPDDRLWYQHAEAMVTIRRYWQLDGEVGRRSLSKSSEVAVFGTIRHMGRLDYYGIGPDSMFHDRSAFRLRESSFGSRGWFRPTPAVRLGGSTSIYVPDLGSGARSTVPSIETIFPASHLSGFDDEPFFGRYRGFAELLYPVLPNPGPEETDHYQGVYQIALEAVRDHDSGRHSFHRWETEVQQTIPGLRPGQRLTLHGFLAATNEGADIPLYMLYTLGGSGGLKSFRPDLLGSDGTRATLRGYRNFRFRDRNLLLMQAEYRIPIASQVRATVFVDAGQVGPRTADLFSDIKTGTGFSLSYVRKNKALARVDVGYAGDEGVRVFWSFGGFVN
jgi:hypothetical protein